MLTPPPVAGTTAERFFRIDSAVEHLHYVTDVLSRRTRCPTTPSPVTASTPSPPLTTSAVTPNTPVHPLYLRRESTEDNLTCGRSRNNIASAGQAGLREAQGGAEGDGEEEEDDEEDIYILATEMMHSLRPNTNSARLA